ncbi:MAG: hypothetical protein ACI307_02735 [Sodaliphilus sp.]
MWTCKQGKAEHSLEAASRKAVSLGESVVASHHRWGHTTLDTHDAPFFAAAAVFFRRSRPFFREAAFSSGGEGCEWGAKQPTVSSEWGYNGENSFSALSPFAGSRKGFSPHIPAPDFLFSFIHPKPSLPPKKENSLLVLPTVHTIINFATKFFEMFTKLQSEQPHKVFQMFQVFRVFQVLQVRFWTTKPPGFGPNPNKTHKLVGPCLRHIMPAKTPKKAIHTLVYEYDTVLCYRRSFFRRSRLFFREAAFSSGGEGCEWGAKQPTVSSEWGYNGENSFSALSPFAGSRKGFSPHIPAPDFLFSFIHPKPSLPPNKGKFPFGLAF